MQSTGDDGHPAAGSAVAVADPSVDLDAMLGELLKITRARKRGGLTARLDAQRHRLADPSVVILVVGEYKKGKSSLVNALVDYDICPVDDDLATSVPTFVRYGEQPAAVVHFQPRLTKQGTPDAPDGDASAGDPQSNGSPGDAPALPDVPPDQPLAIGDIAEFVTEGGNPGNQQGIRSVEVSLPSPLLQQGLVMVDTPGMGGLTSAYGVALASALAVGDGLLFVSDASQELTRPEVDLLTQAKKACPQILFVLTKVDLYLSWHRIQALDLQHLRDAEVDATLLPVSSTVHRVAQDEADAALDEESGLPRLRDTLRDRLLPAGRRQRCAGVAGTAVEVLDLLRVRVSAEVESLDVTKAAASLAKHVAMRDAAQRLAGPAARWRTVLQESMEDLRSELSRVGKDLTNDVFLQVDKLIEKASVEQIQTELEPLIQKAFMQGVTDKQAYLQQRMEQIVDNVRDEFEVDDPEHVLAEWRTTPVEMSDGIDTRNVQALRQEKDVLTSSLRQASLYQGAVEQVLGSMWGFSLNPIVLGFNVLLGGLRYKQMRRQHLNETRQQYRTAVRAYLNDRRDDVLYGWRTDLTQRQRALRDYFSSRATELLDSAKEAVDAAQKARGQQGPEAAARLAALNNDLNQLSRLRDRLVAISGG